MVVAYNQRALQAALGNPEKTWMKQMQKKVAKKGEGTESGKDDDAEPIEEDGFEPQTAETKSIRRAARRATESLHKASPRAGQRTCEEEAGRID